MRTEIQNELIRIAKKHNGRLLPPALVEEAQPEDSPLHPEFEWDDTICGREHRLHQARMLIRGMVELVDAGPKQVLERRYVSLTTDRQNDGGYRPLVTVLNDKALRAQLLRDAMQAMEYFESKYRRLTELSDVFEAMRQVKKTHGEAA